MAQAHTDDGVKLYYEESGSGAPLIFLHQLPYIYGLDPRLENVQFFSDGTIDFFSAELR